MHTKLPTVLTINSEEDWSTLTKQPHGQSQKDCVYSSSTFKAMIALFFVPSWFLYCQYREL